MIPITPAVAYDMVTHSSGFGGYGAPTDVLQSEARARVEAAEAGSWASKPSTPSRMRKAPANNTEAYFLAAFWVATGAVQTGQTALASVARKFYNEGESYYEGLASWVTGGIYQSGGQQTDKIHQILKDAGQATFDYGAKSATTHLGKLLGKEVKNPALELGIFDKVQKKIKNTVIDIFVPRALRGKVWIVPVVTLVLIGFVVGIPLWIRKIRRKKRKKA